MNFSIDNFITAFAAVSAAIISWLATRGGNKASAQADEIAKLRSDLRSALQQTEAFHVLEGLLLAELEQLGAGSQATLKIRFRDQVEQAGFARPSLTAHGARVAITELEGSVTRRRAIVA